ncbi:DUF2797 domain-containing protein [Kitasatospora viridis]|uniref:Uncharacterized protein DUF2797 n=1 Tax=Kitasatospora viridis TaxID=281105 RepID=A0A561SEL9_9ACTN|nr:DUF2797 domain-containing protein [Kitasatospora viridis]TWF73298.1 uncharacterized protein DUF2797 [Kitasatospora viridis]
MSSHDAAPAWRAAGLSWSSGQAELKWRGPAGQERRSPLPVGAELALLVGAQRRCTGLWRSGRRLPCPFGAEVAPDSRAAVCPACERAGRAHSVATDTALDDPREFAVYLAHHGSAGLKVGITAVQRGTARLLEQGALASLLLVSCRLPAARRTETLLSTVLGVPERISTPAKRRARLRPAPPVQRAADLLDAAGRAGAIARPADGVPTGAGPADHTADYGLPAGGLRPVAAVLPLTPGQVLAGQVLCRIGPDVYLGTAAGPVLLDSRLLSGWALVRAAADAAPSVGLAPIDRELDQEEEQDALF